jgi:hypothetical protein
VRREPKANLHRQVWHHSRCKLGSRVESSCGGERSPPMFSGWFRSASSVEFLFAVTSTAVLCTAALDANGASAANGGTTAFEQTTDKLDYNLTGIVINSVTREPIRSALVQISFSRQLSTLTGSDGKFRLKGSRTGRPPSTFANQIFSSRRKFIPSRTPNACCARGQIARRWC